MSPPSNVTKILLNLNFEVRWMTPSDANNDTMYTVKYSPDNRKWYIIPECAAIQRTECANMTQSFLDLFNQKRVEDALRTGFQIRVYRHDGPLQSASPSTSIPFTPYMEATISAPSILKLDATSDSQRVGLVAPQTPFPDGATGKHIRMDDTSLPGVSKIYYNYTLWRTPNGATDTTLWTMEGRSDDFPAKHGMHDYTSLQLSNLAPNTEYVLTVQARIGLGGYSADTATLVWKTREAAPSEGPTLYSLEFVEIDCNDPDSRDIRVKWKPPPRKQWNGDSLYYEVRFSRMEPGGEHVTLNVTSSTSTTIYDLSRWDRYDVVVFANTSAGGTASLPKSVSATVVGMANSKPEAIEVLTDPSDPTQVIAWEPPTGYQQCILGYRMTLQPEAGGGEKGDLKMEETVLNGTEWEIGGLEPNTYTVEVAAIVKTGFESTSLGVARNIRLIVGPVRNVDAIITAVIVVCVLIVCLLTFRVIYRKIKKSCKDERFRSLKDNKILKRATSETYSSLRRHVPEKETYDLLNQREPLERQTSSLSRGSGESNRTTGSSGYSTDTKSSAVDDISLSDNDEGKAPADDVVSPSWLRQSSSSSFSSSDDGVKDSVFVGLLEVASDEVTNQRDSGVPSQSSSRAPTGLRITLPGKDSAAVASGYTPVTSCCPSRQTSVNEDPSACRKTSRVSCDSAPTSPYLENYPIGRSLDYTVLASTTLGPSQPHPLAIVKSNSSENQGRANQGRATSDASDSNNERATVAVKNDLSFQDSEIENYSKSLLVQKNSPNILDV
ncbi:uncharacterized protein LOC119737476 [Patiria miniata]|uniref:Fibronectin type-III domain-containing protein n=1 Tax=Patiria miniata TaxID=46514 RepID=A0A914AVK8_PATMI|nr:uncharacterized protein LOC119737476 [Patiria miniata]